MGYARARAPRPDFVVSLSLIASQPATTPRRPVQHGPRRRRNGAKGAHQDDVGLRRGCPGAGRHNLEARDLFKEQRARSREFNEIALLLGVASVSATKKFYAERGLKVAKSFGPKYVEFESTPGAPVKPLATGARRLPRTRESPRRGAAHIGS